MCTYCSLTDWRDCWSLLPVSVLTGAASGTVLCWHWWLHRAHPMHSGWKLNLAFSWSWIGGRGDGALSHWQAGPEPYLWHGHIKETSGRKNPEDPILLGNNYSETYSQSPLETIHKSSSVRICRILFTWSKMPFSFWLKVWNHLL